MSNIDCSLNGGLDLSPSLATVRLYGKKLTIEEHIKDVIKEIEINGIKYNYLNIDGKDIDYKFLNQYYSALWVKFFDNNEKITDKIRNLPSKDFYSSELCILDNLHVDIINKFFKVGRYAVVRDYKELRDILGNSEMWNYKDFLISQYKNVYPKKTKKVIECAKNTNFDIVDAIDLKNTLKPNAPDKIIRTFKFNSEKFKIVKQNSMLLAFKVRRSNSNYSDISIFNINKLKNKTLRNIESEYSRVIEDKKYNISKKSIKTISLEIYNYINKK